MEESTALQHRQARSAWNTFSASGKCSVSYQRSNAGRSAASASSARTISKAVPIPALLRPRPDDTRQCHSRPIALRQAPPAGSEPPEGIQVVKLDRGGAGANQKEGRAIRPPSWLDPTGSIWPTASTHFVPAAPVLALTLAPPGWPDTPGWAVVPVWAVIPGWVVIPAWAPPVVLALTRAPRTLDLEDTPTLVPVAVTPKPASVPPQPQDA